jgi:hypothetical protein
MPKFQEQPGQRTGATDGTAEAIVGIGGGIPGMNLITPGIGAANAAKNENLYRDAQYQNAVNLNTPDYLDPTGIEAGYSGDFNPQTYGTPESANATMIDDSPEGRAAQLAALRQMAEFTDQSVGSTAALGRYNAEMDARQLAQSREGAIRQDAMRRGQLGGAADMISRQQAAQAAANQNLNSGMQSAQLQALQQLAGMQAAGGLAGQLRGQDLQRNTGNAGIANQFELYNVGNRNDMMQANTGLQNSAGLRNLNASQDFLNNRTNLGMQKLGVQNQNRSKSFADQVTQLGGVNTALEGKANATRAGNKDATEAGKIAWSNFKDTMKMAGGGMG